MTHEQRRVILKDYFDLIEEEDTAQSEIDALFADPGIKRPEKESLGLRLQLKDLRKKELFLSILAETIIQDQVSEVVSVSGLAVLNQPIPPILFRISNLPKNLILSPRGAIRQEASISLNPEISIEQIIQLEERVEEEFDFSALVVPVGGVGSYPSMIIRSDKLSRLFETVSHEWTHNYLSWHPLGIRYNASPSLRTMNETTASIAGKELSAILLEIMFLPPSRKKQNNQKILAISQNQETNARNDAENGFNYQQEMYDTRLHAETLLAEGKVEDAEAYMESRRQVFWENGFQIRRLNQAYFAFYGAYADQPISAAGADPVGKDVRILWNRSENIEEFIRKMAELTSYDELRVLVDSF